jgi:predicted ferric reductase
MNDIDHTYWYLNRASGFVAYLLLFVAVGLGLTMTGGVLERVLRRYRVYDLHRFVSILTLGVCVFHVLIVLPDDFIRYSLAQVLLPFASPYEPLFIALGGFSLYLTALIVGTFYVRHLVSYHVWRLLHYGTFVAFALALVHGVGAGADSGSGWAQYLYAATALVAFNLLVYRALRGSARAGRVPEAGRFPSSGPATEARRA